MGTPNKMKPAPQSAVTVQAGIATDASSEFWQRVAGNVHVVYENVPHALAREILESNDPDTAIKLLLANYPRRVSA